MRAIREFDPPSAHAESANERARGGSRTRAPEIPGGAHFLARLLEPSLGRRVPGAAGPEDEEELTLAGYGEIAHLVGLVDELAAEAARVAPRLRGRTVWMVNSTAQGGGVAEMLPKTLALLNEVGVATRWLVVGAERREFFAFTKRLHNLIHGTGEPRVSADERAVFEAVSRDFAAAFRRLVSPGDIVVIHDPQPAGMIPQLRAQGVKVVWRCHIGLDERLPQTRAAWGFLRSYAERCDRAVFSAPDYVPGYLADRAAIIRPALDPESPKNRELPLPRLIEILAAAGLLGGPPPATAPPFVAPVRRLRPDGSFGAPGGWQEIGLLHRPIVTQVSRWDRLKGFGPLLSAFALLKDRSSSNGHNPRDMARLRSARLVLAGPDPASIEDDPEGREVLDELVRSYRRLPLPIQEDVALLLLPMSSRRENALIVNALQRCASVVVQNSLREGFGLTATEAMWKRVGVVGTRACGLRQQIEHDVEGLLVENPGDPAEIAGHIESLLVDDGERRRLGRAAQRRVHRDFLIFTQLRQWLRLLESVVDAPAA